MSDFSTDYSRYKAKFDNCFEAPRHYPPNLTKDEELELKSLKKIEDAFIRAATRFCTETRRITPEHFEESVKKLTGIFKNFSKNYKDEIHNLSPELRKKLTEYWQESYYLNGFEYVTEIMLKILSEIMDSPIAHPSGYPTHSEYSEKIKLILNAAQKIIMEMETIKAWYEAFFIYKVRPPKIYEFVQRFIFYVFQKINYSSEYGIDCVLKKTIFTLYGKMLENSCEDIYYDEVQKIYKLTSHANIELKSIAIHKSRLNCYLRDTSVPRFSYESVFVSLKIVSLLNTVSGIKNNVNPLVAMYAPLYELSDYKFKGTTGNISLDIRRNINHDNLSDWFNQILYTLKVLYPEDFWKLPIIAFSDQYQAPKNDTGFSRHFIRYIDKTIQEKYTALIKEGGEEADNLVKFFNNLIKASHLYYKPKVRGADLKKLFLDSGIGYHPYFRDNEILKNLVRLIGPSFLSTLKKMGLADNFSVKDYSDMIQNDKRVITYIKKGTLSAADIMKISALTGIKIPVTKIGK